MKYVLFCDCGEKLYEEDSNLPKVGYCSDEIRLCKVCKKCDSGFGFIFSAYRTIKWYKERVDIIDL